jgi:hypothetical protein
MDPWVALRDDARYASDMAEPPSNDSITDRAPTRPPAASADDSEAATVTPASSQPRIRAPKPSIAPDSTAAVTGIAGAPKSPETDPDAVRRSVEIQDGGLDVARAEHVSVTRGGITTVDATTVELQQGGITRVDARDVSVRQGGIAIARADRVTTDLGAIGISLSGASKVQRSFVRAMLARDVSVEQGAIWNLAAGRVTFQRQGFAGIVVAGRVDGNVKAVLDWRGALAFGAAFGLLWGILRNR